MSFSNFKIKYVYLLVFSFSVFAQEFTFPITISDGIVSHDLTIGLNANASIGYDEGIDVLAPPAPPPGSFDTRLIWQDVEYFTDIRDTSAVLKIFPISYSPTTGEEIVLHWNSTVIPTLGVFTIVDDIASPQFTLVMSTTDSLGVSTSSYISDSLKIIVNPGGLVDINYNNEIQPSEYKLYHNYPNPFNPTTSIKFALPKSEDVRIEIYNMIGQIVWSTFENQLRAGYHVVRFNAEGLPSGLYFYIIEAGDFQAVKKMVLLR